MNSEARVPLHKKLERAFSKLKPDDNPRELIEIAFKHQLAELFIIMIDEKSVKKNRLSSDAYKSVSRYLINEFCKADLPDKAKLSVEKYEEIRDQAMQEIGNEIKNSEGRDTAQVKTVLDLDRVGHAREMRSKSGIIIPNGVKV